MKKKQGKEEIVEAKRIFKCDLCGKKWAVDFLGTVCPFCGSTSSALC